ncbi:MAG TPA: hypothetical protein VJU54_04845 [Nitrospiraceae bacterium]|nr:hypothetical protein [Nitrospiraceae bacterium]
MKGTLQALTLRTALILLVVLMGGCSSSTIYGWHVRTNSTPPSPTFNRAVLTREPVALFGALAPPRLLGSETGLESILAQVLKTVGPSFKVITHEEAAGLINKNDLANEYTRMRNEALQSHVLDQGSLKKLGTAIGTRYVFQPKLIEFMQVTKDRWELPPVALKVSRIRSSYMRLSLQLWDMQTGALLWTSLAEASLESEAVGQDPVYFEDTARVSMGSAIADFLSGKTTSSYGPLDKIVDQLIQIPQSDKPGNTDNLEPDSRG